MNSEDRSDGEVESGGRCRITGLPVVQRPEWTDVDFGRDYRVTLRVLGDRILHSRPSGFATRRDTEQALEFTQSVVQERFGNRRYVQIEDYTRLRGASLDGRKAFIQGMRARDRMVGLVFLTISPVFKVSIQLAKRLTSSDIGIHIAGDYEEALRWAEDCLRGQGLSLSASGIPPRKPLRGHDASTAGHAGAEGRKQPGFPWARVETHDAWTLHLEGFSIQYERPADDVVHTLSAGRLEEKHLEPLFKHMEDVFSSMVLEGVPFFLMNSLESVSTITWRTRRLITRKMASLHERFPFRLNVFYGAGGLLVAAIHMGRPMVPFQVAVAKDLPGAWDLVSESRSQGEGPGRRVSSFEPTQASIDDLFRFLGNINWEVKGEEDSTSVSWDASHPLSPVFDAFLLIKNELDQLLEERQGASNALHIERAYLLQLFENSQMAMVRGSRDGVVQQVNRAFSRMFGYTPEEAIGRDVDLLIVPQEKMGEAESMTRRVDQGEKISYETCRRHKDGTPVPVEMLAFPIIFEGRQVGAYSMYLGIGERVRAEEAMRASEKKYRDLFENVSDLLYVHDMDGQFLEANPAFRNLVGLSEEELLQLNIRHLMPKKNHPRFEEYLERIRVHGVDEGFFRLQIPNGPSRVIEYRNSLITDERGHAMGVRGSGRDLTDRLRAEKALRESEERHRSILENMDEGYYETDPAGNFTFVNQAMSAVLGYTREELIGTNNRNYMDRETARNVYAAFNRVYRSGRPEKGFEWETIRKDGSRGVVETSVSLKLDERGKAVGFRGLVRDVTEREIAGKERERLEAQLQHAQRMEAVGTLAGGIAHNFNNLLMGIQGNASLMALDLPPDHPHGERIKTIEKLVRSGSELTRQLLGYAREGRYEVRPVDLNHLVQDTAGTFGAARKEIRVCTELYPSLHTVLADPGQIEQALMNLFVNAADAMPRGGDLVIRTKDVSSSDMEGKSYIPKEGEYALLEVQDSGLGMDEATRVKVFEPFFTTKGFSKGTGLGLASVYGIVKAHGGYIDVVSQEGRGTTFRMYLPSTEARPEVSVETEIPFHKGEGAVLLVDDEEAVLDVGAEMLSRLNYLVYRAGSGEEAVRMFQEKQELIRLVILDMIMPGMGGGEVFDRLKEIDPHVKVLLASGYSLDGNAAEILKRGCDDFIQKPFDLTVLSQKLGGLQGVRKENGEQDV